MKHILEETDISLTSIHHTIHLSSPSWLLKQPAVILDLNKLPKNKTHPLTYQEKLSSIQEIYPIYQHIFTDGSKVITEHDVEQFSTRKLWKNVSQKKPPYFLPKSML